MNCLRPTTNYKPQTTNANPSGLIPEAIWLKPTRQGDYMEIEYSFQQHRFELLRIAYFPPGVPVQIGVMAAAPEGNGFRVLFEDFKVEG